MRLLGFLLLAAITFFLFGFLFSFCSAHAHRLLLPFDLLGTQLGTFLPPLLFIPIALNPFQQGPFLLDFFFFTGIFSYP
jgi:hypothetical protein